MTPEVERRAWVLNLDAELELEARGAYAPTAHVRAIVREQATRVLGALVAPGDVVLDGTEPEGSARGLRGSAWSPTPRACRILERAGAVVPSVPDVGVLRTVNERRFAASVRAPLVRASFAKSVALDIDAVAGLVARPARLGWLVRRPYGAAGRGRRRVESGRLSPDDLAWAVAGLRRGALVVEPWVEVTREHTRSGFVQADGRVVVAPPCFQATTREGAWTGTVRAERGEVTRADDAELANAAEAAGRALARAGYFGPYGIDAFRHRDAEGRDVLNPLSEINARFTMDWTVAMDALAVERA